MKKIKLKNGILVKIDDDDFEYISKYKWCSNGLYACRANYTNKKTVLLMHTVILGKSPKGKCIDHINGNRFDNRKCNLRFVTHSQNSMNRVRNINSNNKSGYRGVHWSKKMKQWRASIGYKNKTIYIGVFRTPELAFEAYCKASQKYHKEFGITRKINPQLI